MTAGRKQYDREYFDRWYRNPDYTVVQADLFERRVHLAVSVAEYLLERRIRRVLDVGCGEGVWRGILKRIRPRARYIGVDPSRYVVGRYGRRRNIRHGGLENLDQLGLRGRFDLIVCSDVMHYVQTPPLRRGLRTIHDLLCGVAFMETFAKEDEIEGDSEEFQQRSIVSYHRLFKEAGLVPVGLHCYVTKDFATRLTAFEKAVGK
jgi:SAM-dependent methyltransferase